MRIDERQTYNLAGHYSVVVACKGRNAAKAIFLRVKVNTFDQSLLVKRLS